MYKIRELEIKDFRGFRHRTLSFPDADIVLVTGGNGFGKSSFFDAIEWGLTGSLRRYAASNQERKTETILKNNYSKQTGYIRLLLESGDTERIEFSRKIKKKQGNDFNPGELQGLTQQELENALVREEYRNRYDFTRIFNFSHLLSQELIDEFVRGFKATDRYSVLSQLIGIQDYVQYKDKIQLLEREVQREKERLKASAASLQKDMEKYLALVKKEFDVVEGVEERYQELMRRSASLLEEDLPAQLQGDSAGQMLDAKEKFYSRLSDASAELERRTQILTQNQDQVTTLLAALPQYEERKSQYQVALEEVDKWGNLLKLTSKLETVESVLQDFTAYQDAEENRLLYQSIKRKRETLLEQLTFCERSEIAFMHKLQKLIEWTGDPALCALWNRRAELEQKFERISTQIEAFNAMELRRKNIELEIIQTAYQFFAEHLTVEQCPVCKGKVEPEKLLEELRQRLDDEGEETCGLTPLLEEKNSLLKQIEEITAEARPYITRLQVQFTSELEEIASEEKELEQNIERLTKVMNNLDDLNLHPADCTIAEVKSKLEIMRAGLMQTEAGTLTREMIMQRIKESEAQAALLKKQMYHFEAECNEFGIMEISENMLLTSLDVIRAELATQRSKLSQLATIREELAKIIAFLKNSFHMAQFQQNEQKYLENQAKLAQLETLRTTLDQLSDRVPDLVNEMTQEILDHYKKTVNEFYQLLNPQPFFTRLDWEVNQSSQNNGTLVLKSLSEDGKYQMNPSFTFSAAQVNLIALSFFLSFAVQQQWSKLGSIFMDDPVQNMDDINIFAFVDVIRGLCLNSHLDKQIFISTHDRKFVQFMLKKFRMLKVFVLDYKGFGEDGPVIEERLYSPRSILMTE